MAYQLDRKMFTEFVLTWKNAMLSERGYTIVYPAGPQMCTKLCRKKGLDVLVIMNLFRETASPWKRKKPKLARGLSLTYWVYGTVSEII